VWTSDAKVESRRRLIDCASSALGLEERLGQIDFPAAPGKLEGEQGKTTK
jgi:hypothetical protein